MKIAFFSENTFTGKVPRNFEQMRTEFAWMCALDANHYTLPNKNNPDHGKFESHDLGIIIIPKKGQYDWDAILSSLKPACGKLAVMQEGPNWYWQDYPIEQQFDYYGILSRVDTIFAHNKSDVLYYQGHFPDKSVYTLQSLMIENSIIRPLTEKTKDVIIGGNFCSWYSGFDSYVVAKEYSDTVYIPSMGRKIVGEEQVDGLVHLPYMKWVDWIAELSKYKVGIHLMRTHAAGTFALNCAFLGIPCIGYNGLDTQMVCHPETTVDVGDIHSAKKVMLKLAQDLDFYKECSIFTQKAYDTHYSERIFLSKFYDKFQ